MTACRICYKPFDKSKMGQIVCGVACAQKLPVFSRKEEKQKLRERKEAVKTRSQWMKEAQQAFNAWIRARDKAVGYGCISCGTQEGKENAGHYLSTGARPELRFDPMNVHLQCERCNTFLHGNLIRYRVNLGMRHGLSVVQRLEGPHDPKKYTIEDLKAIKAEYKDKLKGLAQRAGAPGVLPY
jgi:hypothetical protein